MNLSDFQDLTGFVSNYKFKTAPKLAQISA